MELRECVILITGATGTLGRALVQAADATGARLALTARQTGSLETLAADLGLAPERTRLISADLSDAESVEALVARIAADWGGVDVLLNAAGGWAGGERLADLSPQAWDAQLDLNLRTVYLVCRAVLPTMLQRGWGRIVNVASRAALEPAGRQAAYNVAKAGVVALTASIAQDYRRKGVTANVILPSIIDSAANRVAMPDADYARWVKPTDIASMMLYLCSDQAAAISGASIPMYGGV